ncbi:unnamed protein product [Meloidogyne enterolobii]|uniref:Uncharacterized protein n=1 Tax=Meloidogyne enterolobii TaxID=390850 RepID=A0ACB1AX57_MELEN
MFCFEVFKCFYLFKTSLFLRANFWGILFKSMNSPLHLLHCLWFNPITTTQNTSTTIISQSPQQPKQLQKSPQKIILSRKRRAAAAILEEIPPQTTITYSSTKTSSLFDDSDEYLINKKERLWVCADVDRAIHLDERCLKKMLENEINVQVTDAQIRRQQRQNIKNCNDGERGVDEDARAQLVEWLNVVCEAERVDFVILPLTVAFVDRVLATKFLPRRNLQALGAACLLLASKLKAPVPLSAAQIASYCCEPEENINNNNVCVMEADSSLDKENTTTTTKTLINTTTLTTTVLPTTYLITPDELLDWEMLVVNQLKWNLLQSTPFEFFDQILVRSPVLEALREDFAHCLHKMLRV